MIDITVRRGGGRHPGEDIVDRLVTTLPAALSRGRAELDAQASGHQSVTLTVPHVPGRMLGQLIEVHDAHAGVVYRGKITAINHRGSLAEHWSEITLERPTRFEVRAQ